MGGVITFILEYVGALIDGANDIIKIIKPLTPNIVPY